jgi:hypothetical protein
MTRYFLVPAAAILATATPAFAQRTQVSPYIDASQVLTWDSASDDVLTYSTVGVGVDATIETRRVQVQVSYRYDRRFDYQGELARDDMHSGLVQAQATITPGLTVEGGAIATRTRSDVRGDAIVSGQGNVRNVSQVYSAYAGPNLATTAGPAFVNAAYRYGYTKVEAPDGTGVAPDAPRLDAYDDSSVHVATASVGVEAGKGGMPVGVTASGSFTREDAGQLDQRFEGQFARGDVVVPVGRGVALAAGAGYEKIKVSQRDPLLDADGVPVIDRNGRFATDPNSPRRIAYDFDGMFWDAGVIWRPSRRTFLEARVGERYDSLSYTGSFSYQMGPGSGIQIGVYDSVQTFGQQLGVRLMMMPDNFSTSTDPFGNQFSGCVYGTTGAASGGCMNDVFASAPTSAYRARGIVGTAVAGRGNTRFGIGGGYARRTYIAPDNQTVSGIRIDGAADESVFGQFFASQGVGAFGQLSTSVLATYYNSDLPGADGILSWGANTAYSHSFGRLTGTASIGAFGFDRDGETDSSIQALLGLRYGF